jgi:hypothetical protein
MWMNRGVSVVVLLVPFTLLSGCGKSGTDATNPGADPKQPAALGEAQYKMSATEFLTEFNKDRRATGKKYAGAVVEVEGVAFEAVLRGDGRSVGFGFSNPTSPTDVLVCVNRDLTLIGKVTKGRKMRVKGRMSSTPELEDAEILELGPDTAVRMTSEEIAKEASSDFDAFREKCKDKTVVVTGPVVGSHPRTQAYTDKVQELKGGAGTKVFCGPERGSQYRLSSTPDGKTVAWAGELFFASTKDEVLFWQCEPVELK